MARRTVDLSLYLVTDTAMCGEYGVPATVGAAVAGGATVVQLRDPAASDADLVALGRALVARLRGSGVPLVINDRVDLVEQIGADGAHVGQGDLDATAARRLLGEDRILGLSVQTLEHVETARGYEPGAIDYLGVGPVFAQSTKPDAAQPGGLARLRAIVDASPWPCVAIGGIDAARAPLVRDHGAAGIAVVSAICGQDDVTAATRRLRTAWDSPKEAR